MNRVFGIALIALIAGCAGGGDSSVAPINHPPTLALGFSKLAFAKGVPVDLSVLVDDEDDDPVTVTWDITPPSTLTPRNPENTTVRWTVPGTVGSYTLTIRASDGQSSTTVTADVSVGWPTSVFPPTFLRSRSPYIVSADPANPIVSLFEGQASIIEAGTEILVDTPETVFDVTGTLISQGKMDSVVVIRPNARGLQCGDSRGWWEGIRASSTVGGTGDLHLRHTEVWYANNGVRLREQASADIRNCAIKCSGEHGVLHEGFGVLRLIDSDVTDGAGSGVAIDAITALPDSVLIEGCNLRFNVIDGLRVAISDGQQVVPIIVEYTKFESNFTHGVTLGRQSFPMMHFNHFTGNGVSQGVSHLYLENGYPNGASVTQLDATCNYWGASVTQAGIDATIHDSLDNGSIGVRVITDPWLTQSPLTTTPTCTPPSP